MSQIEAVFFDCDGTLVDSEVICSRAYVTMFRQFGITLELTEVFRRFKGVKLYEIIDTISKEHGVALAKAELEPVYRAEVARLFDTELEAIAGANTLLESIKTPMCVVSNGPVSKMQHSLGKLGMLHHFPDLLFSGYDIQRWKPDPALTLIRPTASVPVGRISAAPPGKRMRFTLSDLSPPAAYPAHRRPRDGNLAPSRSRRCIRRYSGSGRRYAR